LAEFHRKWRVRPPEYSETLTVVDPPGERVSVLVEYAFAIELIEAG
jgi:hypothetical protein